MKIYDPIYGNFVVPSPMSGLISSPEFRRLSQIRLLNCITPSLATLGELRRYSHTLGVIRLAMEWLQSPKSTPWRSIANEFLAAVLLHDVATPPFGHIFEYLLRERYGWDHEAVIVDVLGGAYAVGNTAHQIFAHKSLSLLNEFRRAKLDHAVVIAILKKHHPLSKLIFGTLDLDNLDNVTRMSWALGSANADDTLALARSIGVSASGDVELPRGERARVEAWAMMRRKCYDIIVFDPETSAAQAVLTEALRSALDKGLIGVEDWDLTDEGLLDRLMVDRALRDLAADQYLGRLPSCYCIAQWTGPIKDIRMSGDEIKAAATEIALRAGVQRPLIYLFWDSGSFEKELELLDPSYGPWYSGTRSDSLVVYFFSRLRSRPQALVLRQLIGTLHGAIEKRFGGVWNIRFPATHDDAQIELAV